MAAARAARSALFDRRKSRTYWRMLELLQLVEYLEPMLVARARSLLHTAPSISAPVSAPIGTPPSLPYLPNTAGNGGSSGENEGRAEKGDQADAPRAGAALQDAADAIVVRGAEQCNEGETLRSGMNGGLQEGEEECAERHGRDDVGIGIEGDKRPADGISQWHQCWMAVGIAFCVAGMFVLLTHRLAPLLGP